ncbi:MAG: aminoacyl-tRNA hydrolase [Pseudomonadota bacterium]
MLLIVGLGNPGAKYQGNRHNIGFTMVERFADVFGFSAWRSRFQGEASEGFVDTFDGARVKALLLKPQTFYNDSGLSVREAASFFKLPDDQIIVFHDEIDLAPGRVRVKTGGGHSGNNGIRSVIAHNSNAVRRIRLGIGHPGDKSKVYGHVLSDFAKSEADWVEAMTGACTRALPYLAIGEDDRYQAEVMRLAPAPKIDPRKSQSASPKDA